MLNFVIGSPATRQFIVNYSIHHNPTDTTTLPTHLDNYKTLYATLPDRAIADAGYGSEQNLHHLESHQIEAYVKHSFFDKDRRSKKKNIKAPFASQHLHYNKALDTYTCPMGQPMHKVNEHKEKTDNGYERTLSVYQAKNCEGCPLRGVCHKAKGNRQISVSHEGNRLKAEAVERLLSPQGVAFRKQRCWDVEPVFANLKQNKSFRRFMLRGKDKVLIETGLLAMAHNLSKAAA